LTAPNDLSPELCAPYKPSVNIAEGLTNSKEPAAQEPAYILLALHRRMDMQRAPFLLFEHGQICPVLCPVRMPDAEQRDKFFPVGLHPGAIGDVFAVAECQYMEG